MIHTRNLAFIFFLAFVFVSCSDSKSSMNKSNPNIILILADDLGYGDISHLNENSKIQTTHIDALAKNGFSFTDAHSNSSVCTPTRYGLLTGRYAWRTKLKQGVTWSYDSLLINTQRLTIASMLKKHNYSTACIGKWHLGLDWGRDETGNVDVMLPISNGPNNLGFDYFYGIAASLDIPPYIYLENAKTTATSIDTIDKMEGKKFWRKGPIGNDFKHIEVLPTLTAKAIDFIDQQSKSKDPFFLYFALPAPHTPILPTDEFLGKSNTNEYGDFVLMVDDVVRQIYQVLEDNQLTENTIIIFTSDNGCSPMADFKELKQLGHNPNYVYRGSKADIYEGGHRVPFVVHWPAKVNADKSESAFISMTDLMATFADIVGDSLHANAAEDSFSFLHLLTNEGSNQKNREVIVHHSCNGFFAIRRDNWKLNFCAGSGGWSHPTEPMAKEQELYPIQLYDLGNDISEQHNLAEEKPVIVNELTKLMQLSIDNGRTTPGPVQANDREINFLPDELRIN